MSNSSKNDTLFRCCTEGGWFTKYRFLGYELPGSDWTNLRKAGGDIAKFGNALVVVLNHVPESVGLALYLATDSRVPEPLKKRDYPGKLLIAEGYGPSRNRIRCHYEKPGAQIELRVKIKQSSISKQIELLAVSIK